MVKKKQAFTLAEVLITLGVIGVVASMTLPVLIQKHHNTEVENKLKKIYTTMNQAMRMSEIDNGDRKYWHEKLRTKGGIEQYILPYIKYTKVEEDAGTNAHSFVSIYFADGTILRANKKWLGEWDFYTMDIDKCQTFDNGGGICLFSFMSYPDKYYFEGYYYGEGGRYERNLKLSTLKKGGYGCYLKEKRNNCTSLIQYNGWKIPDDYPYKVR